MSPPDVALEARSYVFHSTRLEGVYPDTEVVITYSFTDDPRRKEVRDRIWDYVEK